jgi:outer membrane lipoprotein carrier protein
MRHLNKLVFSTLLTVAASVPSQEVQSPIDRLETLLGSIETLQASFSQQSVKTGMQTGKFWLQKPNQFRIETSAPLSQTIVSNGDSLWTHDRDLEQVIINKLNNRLAEMPVLLFAGDPSLIADSYEVDFFEDEVLSYYILTPLASTSLFTRLQLTFDQSSPTRISVENAMGERTVIDLTDVAKNMDIEAARFTLTIPDNVDVIDDRL